MPNPFGAKKIDQVFSARMARQVSVEDAVTQMGNALPVEVKAASTVELKIDNALTRALPWEWALQKNTICFRSVENLLGLGAPRWSDRLFSALPLQIRHVLRVIAPLRVLLFRQSAAQQQGSRRGYDVRSTRSLVEVFRAHSLSVFEPDASLGDNTQLFMVASRPDIIYVQAPIVERGGQLTVDLAGSATHHEASRERAFGVDFWCDFIRAAEGGSEPVFWLAPPRPATTVDTTRQLLMRNEFASEIASKARVRAVVAEGLFAPEHTDFVAEKVAYLLASKPQLSELLALLRYSVPGDRFCTTAAAVIAGHPRLSFR